jgi:hypothetical protein
MNNTLDMLNAKETVNQILVRAVEIISKENMKLRQHNRQLEAELQTKDYMISALKKELYNYRLREQFYSMGDRR